MPAPNAMRTGNGFVPESLLHTTSHATAPSKDAIYALFQRKTRRETDQPTETSALTSPVNTAPMPTLNDAVESTPSNTPDIETELHQLMEYQSDTPAASAQNIHDIDDNNTASILLNLRRTYSIIR